MAETRENRPGIVDEPVFLVGAERSGTTLMLLILGAHPELCFPGELDFTIECMPGGEPPPLSDYHTFLERNRIFRAHRLTIDPALDFERLINSFLVQEMKRAGRPRVGGSIHGLYANLLRMWPAAKLIHIVRDPRDVATSCIGLGWAGNVWFGVERWIDSESEWNALAPRIPDAQKLEIRFEDVVADIEGSVQKICDFIGIDYSPEMLRYHEQSSYEPVDPSIAQKWRRKLPEIDVRLIEARVGGLLEQAGYEPSGHPPLRVGALRLLSLRLHDACVKRIFRLRKYGWRLSLLRPLARLLLLRDWHARLERRFQDIDDQHLK